jgi:uncharacterized protein (DUF302 family)/rhodanese-related sulfurtransferase
MSSINMKKEITGPLEVAIESVTAALKTEGFGVLTRIDLHTKVKEKIGKDLRPVVILGACNPQLAFEAYSYNSDVASVLPCNAVLRDVGDNRISVELAKPSALMKFLGDKTLEKMALDADRRLQTALDRLTPSQIAEWSAAELHARRNFCEMIDVRGLDEFNGSLSHVEGSKLVTLGPDLDNYLLEKSKAPQPSPIVFICRSGARSKQAALQAREVGLTQVISLKGGMVNYNEAKLPTHQKRSEESIS